MPRVGAGDSAQAGGHVPWCMLAWCHGNRSCSGHFRHAHYTPNLIRQTPRCEYSAAILLPYSQQHGFAGVLHCPFMRRALPLYMQVQQCCALLPEMIPTSACMALPPVGMAAMDPVSHPLWLPASTVLSIACHAPGPFSRNTRMLHRRGSETAPRPMPRCTHGPSAGAGR